jgi:hypothetical protein
MTESSNRSPMPRPRRRSPYRFRHTEMTHWTILLEWIGMWRRPSASVSQRPTTTFPLAGGSAPRIPDEYRPLYTYLEHRYASLAVLTFEQIEALLGFALPPSARTERSWWTDAVHLQRHSAAWTGAGRTATPNLLARNVAFERSP